MNNYKINTETLAIIPISNSKSKIYEKDNVIIVEKSTKKLIEENCRYYGSSYEGRKQGTQDLIGITHKSPIIIEETNNLIFFPTCSPRLNNCGWISLNNIDNYKPYAENSMIRFNNNLTLQLDVSNKVINNQVLRATRLDCVIRKRKEDNIEKKY